jgi:formylglycine-generating enzyme required for sulfatase activity
VIINKKLILILIFAPLIGMGQMNLKQKKIIGGNFVPLYGSNSTGVSVDDFLLDIHPITNQQYLHFVKKNPKWRRSQVLNLFADENYLYNWESDTVLGLEVSPNSAVTSVSWYAAKKYCDCQDSRLPTMDEWEYVAMASETNPNAQRDSLFNLMIIESYELPKTYKNEIGSTYKNYWGIFDMHGLVWEWTSDFNSVLISGESRQDVDVERNLFCGSASINATNLMDYAAFMRFAFRGSVKANYSIRTLGFRCSKDINQ